MPAEASQEEELDLLRIFLANKLGVLKITKEDQKLTLHLHDSDKLVFEERSGPGPFPWISGEVRLEDKNGHVLAKVEL